MRNRMAAIDGAAIAGATILLLFLATPAQAQAQAPGGSYLHSCTHVRMSGDRLVAECQRMDGRWDRTVLRDIDRCIGDIGNTNGQLTCNYGEPGYGSSLERGYGSAPSRYYGYPRYYGFGR